MLVVGGHVSPYARKVLVALAIKGVEHEIDPIVPFYGNAQFSQVSPLRRIPVLIDGDLVLNDSTAIAEYIDERWPEPPLMPRSPADRARARWLEEFADTRLGDLIIWRLFFAKLVRPRVYKREPDIDAIAHVTRHLLPEALDWIETQAPASDFLFGHVCIADISYAGFFRNALLAGFAIDAARWPRTAAWIARVEAIPEFAASIAIEQALVSVPGPEWRAALARLGMKVSAVSHGDRVPQASIMLDDAPLEPS